MNTSASPPDVSMRAHTTELHILLNSHSAGVRKSNINDKFKAGAPHPVRWTVRHGTSAKQLPDDLTQSPSCGQWGSQMEQPIPAELPVVAARCARSTLKNARKTYTTRRLCVCLWSSCAAARQMKSGSSFACAENRWRLNRSRCCRTVGLCLHCTVHKASHSSSI